MSVIEVVGVMEAPQVTYVDEKPFFALELEGQMLCMRGETHMGNKP